jgi:hypothetical protein
MVAPLSTQLRHAVQGVDMLIDVGHPDYRIMALRGASIIRMSQLQLVEKTGNPECDRHDADGDISPAAAAIYKLDARIAHSNW